MNNPQQYQPLGHALHQPSASQPHLSYKPSTVYQPPDTGNPNVSNREEEEEEEEDDPDDADEGLVEEQLNPAGPAVQGSTDTPQSLASTGHVQNIQTAPQQPNEPPQPPEGKRRPGRPRGSKNRKPRAVTQGTSRLESQLHQPAIAPHPPPPQNNDAHGQSQQFYEFQWRILNLCAEFYGAAEELVKGTSPLVLAQCYQTGSEASQDPLKMLTEAKRVCDNLLANPSRFALSAATATSDYPSLSSGFQAPPAPSVPSVQSGSTASNTTSNASTPMITNPQSFVVSLGAQQAYPHAQYPTFSGTATQYSTHYYSQYPYSPHAAPFYQQPILTTGQSQAQVSPLPSTTVASSPMSSSSLLNQGPWSEEETEKLKKLSEDSRAFNSMGEIEWDWVVSQYGNSRTRHQILIKATSLGLKESSSRGTKRRREADDEVGPSGPAPPHPSNATSSSSATAVTAASPTQSQATLTPVNSPALQNQPRPPNSKGPTLSTTPNMPWPMPTVAVNAPSPVMSASTVGQDQQRTSYYRPRPRQDTTKSRTQHNYMYQPANGNSVTGSRLNQENGK